MRRLLLALAFLALAPAPALLAQRAALDANGQPLSLPFHDARLDGDGLTVPAVRQAAAAALTPIARAAREADLAELREQIPGLRLDVDEFFGTPHFLRSDAGLLTDPLHGPFTPLQVVRDFVAEHTALLEVSPAEIDAARVTRDLLTKHNGMTSLTLQQQIDGVDLFGAELKASVTAFGELINVSSTLLPRPEGGFAVPAPRLGPVDAIRLAAADVGIDLVSRPTPAGPTTGPTGKTTWNPVTELRPEVPLTTERVFFPLSRATIHPAWATVIAEPGIGNTYDILVDAVDGTILRRDNRLHFVDDITLNVYTSDSPFPGSPGTTTPNGFQFPEVPRSLVTVTAASIAPFSPAGWVDAGQSETIGNNIDAHTDLNADNAPDLPRPDGGPSLTFDFPLDNSMDPSTFRDAAVTQLFYVLNRTHDKLYSFGFDEAAGNFQDDNFGNGGVGGDRVSADGQDGSGTNNANWNGTGTDGTFTYIQMYIFNGPTPQRDGDLDADVMVHEYCHGLSYRLSGGTVTGTQSGGMGEGWGDYFGISMNAEATDDPHAVYSTGGYVTYQFFGLTDNYYFGIRRYPYSTDMTKSPLTYADIDPAQAVFPPGIPISPVIGTTPNEVHNVGEIWCQVLLECRANLWDVMGFAANDLMMQLTVDGLKLQPSNPNMLEARDGIIQADLVNSGGANLGSLWPGFAKRGMGGSASSPSGSTSSGIVEAFDVPALVQINFPGGTPSQLMPNQATTFTVTADALAFDQPIPGTGMLSTSINGAPFVTAPMNETSPNVYDATLPAADCFDQVDWYVTVDTTAGLVTAPDDAPNSTFGAQVFTGVDVVFADDFETDLGWSVGAAGDTATTGIWERGDPVGTAAQPEDDHTADPASQCFFTGQGVIGGGLGDNDIDGGPTTLLSPSFDLSGGDALVSYWRWYSNDTGADPNNDVFVIDISNDGGSTWSNVETVGPAGPETGGGWIQHEFTVSDVVVPTADMVMRFVAADNGAGSLVEAAVDDFRVDRLLCAMDCQANLGFGGPGSMTLSLCGGPFGTGDSNDLLLEGAPSNGTVFFLFGLSNNPVGFKGGQLVPIPIQVIVPLTADGSGAISGPLSGGGGPATLYMQAVAPDGGQPLGYAISNALQVTVDP